MRQLPQGGALWLCRKVRLLGKAAPLGEVSAKQTEGVAIKQLLTEKSGKMLLDELPQQAVNSISFNVGRLFYNSI